MPGLIQPGPGAHRYQRGGFHPGQPAGRLSVPVRVRSESPHVKRGVYGQHHGEGERVSAVHLRGSGSDPPAAAGWGARATRRRRAGNRRVDGPGGGRRGDSPPSLGNSSARRAAAERRGHATQGSAGAGRCCSEMGEKRGAHTPMQRHQCSVILHSQSVPGMGPAKARIKAQMSCGDHASMTASGEVRSTHCGRVRAPWAGI
jgi:hypothetical protein